MSDRQFPPQEQDRQPGREHAMHPEPEFIRPGYRGADKLKGKSALITGGDSGIGRAVAQHYAREGADVAIVYLEESGDADITRELVESEGRRCLPLEGDVRDAGFCRQCVERTVQTFGGVNILVNNVAEQHDWEDITQIPADQLLRTFQTNVFSYFYFIQAALPQMGEGDSIICTSSINAFKGNPSLIDYTATKGAVQGLVRSLATPLTGKGVRINAVAPGPVWTPLIPASFPDEKVERFGGQVPMDRAAQPSEIAPAYVYLACEESSYMTGQTLHLNGGVVLNT